MADKPKARVWRVWFADLEAQRDLATVDVIALSATDAIAKAFSAYSGPRNDHGRSYAIEAKKVELITQATR